MFHMMHMMQTKSPYIVTYFIIKMKPACPTCPVVQPPCQLWVYSLYVFPACPAEMLTTLRLKTGRFPVLMGSDQIRLFMFMTGLFSFKYGRFVLMTCLEVESWYLTRTEWEVFQDKTVTLQDKM